MTGEARLTTPEATATYWANIGTQCEVVLETGIIKEVDGARLCEKQWKPDMYPNAAAMFGITYGMEFTLVRPATEELNLDTEYVLHLTSTSERNHLSGTYTFKPFSQGPLIPAGDFAAAWTKTLGFFGSEQTLEQMHESQLKEFLGTYRREYDV